MTLAVSQGGDVVAKYRRRVLGLLVAFGDEVLDAVRDAKGVNVEDVRASVLGPLRDTTAEVIQLAGGDDDGDGGCDGGDGGCDIDIDDDGFDLLAAMMSFDTAVDAGAHPSGNASGSKSSTATATIIPS